MKQKDKLEKYKKALEKISETISIKENIRDYRSIALNFQHTAREALAEKCKTCGK